MVLAMIMSTFEPENYKQYQIFKLAVILFTLIICLANFTTRGRKQKEDPMQSVPAATQGFGFAIGILAFSFLLPIHVPTLIEKKGPNQTFKFPLILALSFGFVLKFLFGFLGAWVY